MSKSLRWQGLLAAALVAVCGSVAAAQTPAANDRLLAYQEAATPQSVQGIPATARISDADALGQHSIALYTVGTAGDQIWLVNTGSGCEQPRLAGGQIVSSDAQGHPQACTVTAIHAVRRELLVLQLARLRNGRHAPLDTGSAYGPNNVINYPYETVDRVASMTDNGRTR